eukprot:GEZU01020954.1.p2 GENE.GEZU01020954.1~~GEZU01020954.1.p2  ORF type:complete len:110 (-),score=11.28 GEZU01020954.1:452-739(-)
MIRVRSWCNARALRGLRKYATEGEKGSVKKDKSATDLSKYSDSNPFQNRTYGQMPLILLLSAGAVASYCWLYKNQYSLTPKLEGETEKKNTKKDR